MGRETKRERFERVIESRLEKTVLAIRTLGNTARTDCYEYEYEDVEELFAGLRRELDFAEERFRTKDEARRFHLMEEYHGDQV